MEKNLSNLKIFVLGIRGFPNIQGGVEKHCEELYPRLSRLGCRVSAFVRSPYVAKKNRHKQWNDVRFVYLYAPRLKSLEAFLHTFLSVVVSIFSRPDIIHIHAIGPAVFTPLAKLSGCKVVVTNHGPDYLRQKWGWFAKSILKAGEFLGTKFADRVIVISDGIKQNIEQKYKRKDTVVISNGVPIPASLAQGEALKKYNLKPREYVFTACRFVPEKGLHNLILAYRQIKQPAFRLVIAGDADHESKYSREIKALAKKSPGIILTGFVSGRPLQELYSNAGLFVLPSLYEGLPIALLEAMSYGLPVLVSDIPANKRVFLPEFRFFPAEKPEELAKKLSDLFKRGISTEELEAQKRLVSEEYNWDKIAERTLSIYKSLIK